MNLQTTIKRILREESKKDLSPIIEKLLNTMLVKDNQDIICGVRVKHPSNRVKLRDNIYEHEHYRVDITFIGGVGTKFWPHTQSVHTKYADLIDKAWNIVYDYTGMSVDIFQKQVNECE